MSSAGTAAATTGAQEVDTSSVDFDSALNEMKEAFDEAIANNIKVNKLSTEGKTAVEAARTKPL